MKISTIPLKYFNELEAQIQRYGSGIKLYIPADIKVDFAQDLKNKDYLDQAVEMNTMGLSEIAIEAAGIIKQFTKRSL